MAKRKAPRRLAAQPTSIPSLAAERLPAQPLPPPQLLASPFASPAERLAPLPVAPAASQRIAPGPLGIGPLGRRIPAPTGTQPIARPSLAIPSVATPPVAVPHPGTTYLARIAYVSAMSQQLPRAQLDQLLSTWRRQNASRGITGFLLHHRASVFQVIEGFPDVVAALYETIARDPRHGRIAKLIDEPIAERGFGDWSLGHARMAGAESSALGPLRSFGDPGFRYWHGNEAMARDLIGSFTAGSWRRSIV